MAWTTKQLMFAFLMLVTGSINTLSTKWADKLKSVGYDGTLRAFNHPFFQACGMFLGEVSCLFVFLLIRYCKKRREEREEIIDDEEDEEKRPKPFNPLIFYPPALCDMCGTSLMYLGLTFTYASSFQMLRGAIIIFTALLSVAFLGRKIKSLMWLAIVLVMVGLVVVGLSDLITGTNASDSKADKKDPNGVITGDLLIVMAQVIVSFQMVWEEKFIYKYHVPALQAVGWEGFFGFITLSILLVPMYYIPAGALSKDPEGRLENAYDAFIQLGNSWQLCLAVCGNIVSIAFFNFAGISVTKELSATHRMVLDSCRTLVIWAVALSLRWQKFYWLQVIGFIFLVIGMGLYNGIFDPLIKKCANRMKGRDSSIQSSGERDGLLDNEQNPQYSK
ncbi:solute carrier family 35 member F6-like isoform X2 [Tubulanus polymorphus]|uniref:solute carrier family 35 member F6-like isoform X2 n=1 Tax=Tubulanus polymorphus TaxID=672921 RepID=UPI003DA4060E